MGADEYFHRTSELPLPAVVFWPGEIGSRGEAVAIREAVFKDLEKECYVLRGGPAINGEPVIAAGIHRYMIHEPVFNFEIVSAHMLAYYYYRKLFTTASSQIYTPVIDEMYEDAFRSIFGLPARPPLFPKTRA